MKAIVPNNFGLLFFGIWTNVLPTCGCYDKQEHWFTVCVSNSVTQQDVMPLISFLIAVFSSTNILNFGQICALMRIDSKWYVELNDIRYLFVSGSLQTFFLITFIWWMFLEFLHPGLKLMFTKRQYIILS